MRFCASQPAGRVLRIVAYVLPPDPASSPGDYAATSLGLLPSSSRTNSPRVGAGLRRDKPPRRVAELATASPGDELDP